MNLDGKTALVTGASSGIGRELAGALGARGLQLAVSARRVERLEELAEEIATAGGPKPAVLPADLSVRGGGERARRADGRSSGTCRHRRE